MVGFEDEAGCDGEFASKLDANWHVSSRNELLNSRRDAVSCRLYPVFPNDDSYFKPGLK